MRLDQFSTFFPTEDACVEYLKDLRHPLLGPCPRCGCEKFYWFKNIRFFECKKCRYRISLTTDTVMEYSKIPLKKWFLAMHYMTSIKQVMSAVEMQYQLDLNNYKPVWFMMMKLRDIMGKRDAKYKLSGQVELDEAFFPTKMDPELKDENRKRGAGSQKQTKVLVIVESKPIADAIKETKSSEKRKILISRADTETVSKIVRYLKMIVIDDMKSSTIDSITQEALKSDTKIVSDGSKSHKHLSTLFQEHEVHVENDVDFVVRNFLPWVHIVIGECKSGIDAIHKEVVPEFLQYYLNEYCWKFNRRRFRYPEKFEDDIFYHLVNIAARYKSDLKWEDIEPWLKNRTP